MKFKGFVYLILLTCIFIGCDTVKYAKTRQPLAKYYSFGKDTTKIDISSVDTTFIYISEQELVRTNKGRLDTFIGYTFLKSSSNRLAFFGMSTDTKPTASNIYSKDGQYCFYKIVDNELQLEFYDDGLRRFVIAHFKVYSDKLVMYKDKLRVWWGGKSNHNITFNKSDIIFKKELKFPE